jgi:ATP/maltotriose-dependent transcriptional regulator MalT
VVIAAHYAAITTVWKAMETTVPLIRSKLQRPRLPKDLIFRRRLLDALHAGLDRKLTLISGMAGVGKTTLLAQWLEECPQPSAWLSLDEHDNDRIVFLSCLDGTHTLRTVFAAISYRP